MSVFDRARILAANAIEKYFVNATITRNVEAPRTNADRAAGKRATIIPTTIPARALLGSRKSKLADGTIHQQAVARVNVEVKTGDRLTVGSRTFEVTSVEEINPDGRVVILYIAGLK